MGAGWSKGSHGSLLDLGGSSNGEGSGHGGWSLFGVADEDAYDAAFARELELDALGLAAAEEGAARAAEDAEGDPPADAAAAGAGAFDLCGLLAAGSPEEAPEGGEDGEGDGGAEGDANKTMPEGARAGPGLADEADVEEVDVLAMDDATLQIRRRLGINDDGEFIRTMLCYQPSRWRQQVLDVVFGRRLGYGLACAQGKPPKNAQAEQILVAARMCGVSCTPETLVDLFSVSQDGTMPIPELENQLGELVATHPVVPLRLAAELLQQFFGPGNRSLNTPVSYVILGKIFLKLKWRNWDAHALRRRLGVRGDMMAHQITWDWAGLLFWVVEYFDSVAPGKRYWNAFERIDDNMNGYVDDHELGMVLGALGLSGGSGKKSGESEESAFNSAIRRMCDEVFKGRTELTKVTFGLALTEMDTKKHSWPRKILTLERAFASVDISRDGSFDSSEFTYALEKLGVDVTDDRRVRRWFVALDVDGDGSITFKEFVYGLSTKQCKGLKVFKADALATMTPLQITWGEGLATIDLDTVERISWIHKTALKLVGFMFTRLQRKISVAAPDDNDDNGAASADDKVDANYNVASYGTEGKYTWSIIVSVVNSERGWCVLRSCFYGVVGTLLPVLLRIHVDQLDFDEDDDGHSFWEHVLHYLFIIGPSFGLAFLEVVVMELDLLSTGVYMALSTGVSFPPDTPEGFVFIQALVNQILDFGHPAKPLNGIDPLRRSLLAKVAKGIMRSDRGLAYYMCINLLPRVVVRTVLRVLLPVVVTPVVVLLNYMGSVRVLNQITCLIFGYVSMYPLIDRVLLECTTVVDTRSREVREHRQDRRESIGEALKKIQEDEDEAAKERLAGGKVDLSSSTVSNSKNYVARLRSKIGDDKDVMTHTSWVRANVKNVLTRAQRENILRAVAVAIVYKQCWHPNLLYMYSTLMTRLDLVSIQGRAAVKDLDSQTALLESMKTLESVEEALLVIRLFALAIVSDGVASGAEISLLYQLQKAAGLKPSKHGIYRLAKLYSRMMLEPDELITLFSEDPTLKQHFNSVVQHALSHAYSIAVV